MRSAIYLPASNNSKIHWGLDVLVSDGLERLALIANNSTKLFDVLCLNCDFRADESFMDVYLGEGSIVSVPQLPVELLDALVTAVRELVDGGEALRRFVLEVKG